MNEKKYFIKSFAFGKEKKLLDGEMPLWDTNTHTLAHSVWENMFHLFLDELKNYYYRHNRS